MTVNPAECSYLQLLQDIIHNGELRNGRNGNTFSLFGERLQFNIKEYGFPLITTKRVYWKGVVIELLWFLRGSTDATELQEQNVHIWDPNTTREFLDSVGLTQVPTNHIGAGYGWQWRRFNASYPDGNNGFDQLKYVLSELVNNPYGRRAVLSAWNPQQLSLAALPPCHFTYIFYISKDGLSCQMQMRSCDVGSGLPFNIASTSLLTSIIAHILDIPVNRIIIVTGDTHLYEVHIDSAKEQIQRIPYPFPTLSINKNAPPKESSIDDKIKWIEELTFNDFSLNNYQCHPPLKYPMVA
jgi:thymidylate synthase